MEQHFIKYSQYFRSFHELECLAVDGVVVSYDSSVLGHLSFQLTVIIPVARGKTSNGLDNRIKAEGEVISVLMQVLLRHNVGEMEDESLFGGKFSKLLWISIHEKYSKFNCMYN